MDDLIGLEIGPRPFRIGAENVADFVAVTSDDPRRWAESAPPGFLAAPLFVVAPDLLGRLEGRSIIHGEQTFEWLGPLVIGTSVAVSGTVTRVRDRGGVSFVTFELVVMGSGNDEVARGSSLFLVSGESTPVSAMERVEPQPGDRGAPGPDQRSMSRADLIRYAGATRDWNPVHWDHESAVAAGLPGVVVHGLAQAAWALAAASGLHEGDSPLVSARLRFRNPLLPATPVEVRVDESEGVAAITVTDGDTEYMSARVELAGR